MPDMQTCSVCDKIFDFNMEGFCGNTTGEFVCSDLCAIKKTISRGMELV